MLMLSKMFIHLLSLFAINLNVVWSVPTYVSFSIVTFNNVQVQRWTGIQHHHELKLKQKSSELKKTFLPKKGVFSREKINISHRKGHLSNKKNAFSCQKHNVSCRKKPYFSHKIKSLLKHICKINIDSFFFKGF